AQQLVHAGGPAYVKVGQSIATAQGLLPDEWVAAFAWCRDEVPPMAPGEAAVAVAASLGRPLSEVFASFDPEPRAAASIAQVHDAVLLDGTEVVVKVQRPGLRRRFGADFRVMAVLAAGTTKVSRSARMSNATEILPLAAELVLTELDFRLEARNMIHVAAAGEAAGTGFVRVPRPIPGLITSDVLVMERVPGVPYTSARERYGDAVDGGKLLRLAAAGVLEHALIYGVFHGDLHSGNVLVTEEGSISLVDYGVRAHRRSGAGAAGAAADRVHAAGFARPGARRGGDGRPTRGRGRGGRNRGAGQVPVPDDRVHRRLVQCARSERDHASDEGDDRLAHANWFQSTQRARALLA
ncbi:AarF/ABC1/UbiB kinase family protein, partial [Sporichthya sp.]|uniref:ABC1 kinase family protein n=1 Tax=Sporichthya sp. TaxID=65475 RepID=UPI0017BDE171